MKVENNEMAMNSGCIKTKELMSGAVDLELSEAEYSFFDHHIETCADCRNEFELEKATQSYFRSKVGLLEPPDNLLDLIKARLSEEDRVPIKRAESRRVSFRRYLWPALSAAVAMTVVIVVLITRTPEKRTSEPSGQLPLTTIPQTHDALKLSEYDFQNLLKGEFNSQVKAQDADDVIKFIKEKAGYSIPLPDIRNADWIGGNVGALEKEEVVNVVYKMGTSYMYILAFPASLAHSNAVSLSLECIKALDEDKWFWKESTSGNLQVAWKYQNHVCITTSNLDRADLTAYLKTIKGIDEKGWE